MIISKNCTADYLLTCDIKDYVSAVASMSADDCENNARAMLGRIGGPTFDQYILRIMETMNPEDGGGPPTDSDEYYFAVRGMFPHISAENDVLGRLAGLVMNMLVQRMQTKNFTQH